MFGVRLIIEAGVARGARPRPRPPSRLAPEITGPCVVGPSHAGRAGNWSRSEGRGEGEALKIRDISTSLPNLHLRHNKQKRPTMMDAGWPNWIDTVSDT